MDGVPAAKRAVGVVDDDAGSRAVLTAFLRDEGYAVVSADTVEDAVRLVAHEKPAALLLDVLLPDGGPEDLLARLREVGAEIPPLVLMSAETDDALDQAQHATGAVAALAKPFDLEIVLGVLHEVVAHIRVAGSLERVLANWPANKPPLHELRCGACHWLLYLGDPHYHEGMFAGHREGSAVICPACGGATPLIAIR